jgi:choline dehydrogenase-like flavoprotein
MTHTFDAIIIGAGQAGPSLAGRLTAAGQSVALIERKISRSAMESPPYNRSLTNGRFTRS